MRRPILLSLSMGMIVIGLLVACGGPATATPTSEPTPELTETAAPTEVPTLEPTSEIGGPVAILVVDDFGPLENFHITDDELVDIQNKNCIVSWNGQGYGSQGVAVGNTKEPHGVLVYELLRRLLEYHGGSITGRATPRPPNASWLRGVQQWKFNSADTGTGQVLLIGVDTEGFTTEKIAQNIAAAISFFGNGQVFDELTTEPAAGFVLNLSFAVVPCDPAAAGLDYTTYASGLVEAGLSDLKKQLADLVSGDRSDAIASWIAYPVLWDAYKSDSWREGLNEDPLRTQFAGLGKGGPIIVAAAGNHAKSEFPFAPALWPGVLAVSGCWASCPEAGGRDSNPGEVLEIGQDTDDRGSVLAEGSSFAAPRVTVLEAFYLLKNGSLMCSNGPSWPPLDHANENQGTWDDLSVAAASASYCSSFPVLASYP